LFEETLLFLFGGAGVHAIVNQKNPFKDEVSITAGLYVAGASIATFAPGSLAVRVLGKTALNKHHIPFFKLSQCYYPAQIVKSGTFAISVSAIGGVIGGAASQLLLRKKETTKIG
jgi:hypothetical protein